jgi:hypothetical protein
VPDQISVTSWSTMTSNGGGSQLTTGIIRSVCTCPGGAVVG